MSNKVYRNPQEQLQYVTDEIEAIKQSLGSALPDPIPGPTGATGPAGPKGNTGDRGPGIVGYGTELPASAQDGDMFILRTTVPGGTIDYVMYKWSTYHWLPQFSMRGPAGPIGPEGGTEVVANPADAASDDISKIKIDGVTYDVLSSTLKEFLANIATGEFGYVSGEGYKFGDDPVSFDYPVTFYNGAILDNGNNLEIDGGTIELNSGAEIKVMDGEDIIVHIDDTGIFTDYMQCDNQATFNNTVTVNDDIDVYGNGNFYDGNDNLTIKVDPQNAEIYAYTGFEVYDSVAQTYVKPYQFEKIKDSDGHYRFAQGTINTETISGVTWTYNKWVLSGNHLMLVLAGDVASGTTLGVQVLGGVDFTGNNAWMNSKIVPLFASSVISINDARGYYDDWNSVNMQTTLMKASNNGVDGVYFYLIQAPTYSQAGHFRIQFDLLID